MQDDEFRQRSVSAVKWSMAGTATQFTLQFGVQVLLARMLGPENYGIFAMALLAVHLCNLLCQGMSWGLVQAREVGHDEARVIFTWQVLFGIVVTAALMLLAQPLAAWFGDARVTSVLHWLSLACLLTSFSSAPTSLIKREMDFRYLNIVKVASYALGYVAVGLPMAWLGHGVYALVAAMLTQSLCVVILVWLRLPRMLLPLFWHRGAPPLATTGLTAVATNLCNWILNNLDRMVLARILPAASMGLYTVGSNLANLPSTLLLTALQPSFLAAGARIQDSPERLRRAYLSVLSTLWIAVTPLFVMLALLAFDVVEFLYGSAWLPAAGVLTLLALSMPAYITWGLSTPVLWNTGKKHFEMLLQLPVIAVAVLAFLLFSDGGMMILATIAACTLLARGLITTIAACRLLNISMRDLWPLILRGGATTLLAAGATWPAADAVRSAGGAPLLVLITGGGVGVLTLLFVAYTFPSLLGQRVLDMLGRFSGPLQTALSPIRPRS